MSNLYTNEAKLMFWSDRILNIEENPQPIHLVVAVTGRCNFNCEYCYLIDNKSIDLDIRKVMNFISQLPIKGIEITGGEPTLYKDLNKLIDFCYERGIKIGMTTNGSLITDVGRERGLCPIKEENFKKFSWIRISVSEYYWHKHNDNIPFPTWTLPKNVHFGFNMVYSRSLNNCFMVSYLKELMKANPTAKYCRVSLDRNANEETKEFYRKYREAWMNKYNDVLFRPEVKTEFYQGKCYCGYLKPILEWDGKVYNCISELEMYGHKSPIYITDIDHPEKLLKYEDREYTCKYCYYKNRNEVIKKILEGFHKEFL